MYKLLESNNKHNHKLEIKATARDVDEVILARIKLLVDSTKNNKKLTNIINQEFKMNFTNMLYNPKIKR